LVLASLYLQVWTGPPAGPEYEPSEEEKWLLIRAREAVNQVGRVVGHNVRFSEVRVRPLEPSTLARFHYLTGRVEFSSAHTFSVDELLDAAAHETVHAILHKAGLSTDRWSPGWEARLLVEETTAYVLGAHIAGQARTRQGGDGEALTRKLIARYRESTDWNSPSCPRRKLWERAIETREADIDLWEGYSIAVHFGSPEMVDAIDEICRAHPDPWDAAHAVAERYLPESAH
jgi:hypothetical protein